MLFAGDQDFICNYVGIESLIQGMEWNGETGLGVSRLSRGRNILLMLMMPSSADGSNAVMVGSRLSGGDMGVFEKPDIRQGRYRIHPSTLTAYS